MSKKTTRSILEDIRAYDKKNYINEEVKLRADEIYSQKMKKIIFRKKNRTLLLFYCVYCAYLELDILIPKNIIADIFELKENEVKKTNKLFSEINTGYKPPTKQITPIPYIINFMQKMEISEDMKPHIQACAEEYIAKNPDILHTTTPHTAASGLMKYICSTYGIRIDNVTSNEVLCRSVATINNTSHIIAINDNDE